MSNTFRCLLIIYLLFFLYPNHIQAKFGVYTEDEERAQVEKKKNKTAETMKIQSLTETEVIVIGEGQFKLIKPKVKIDEETAKILKELKKTEDCLKSLIKERETLVGDFWGINVTARRYDNVFDRRNYIRYKILQTDKKIKETKLKISKLREGLNKSVKSPHEKLWNR